jgi:hypothetical protein
VARPRLLRDHIQQGDITAELADVGALLGVGVDVAVVVVGVEFVRRGFKVGEEVPDPDTDYRDLGANFYDTHLNTTM